MEHAVVYIAVTYVSIVINEKKSAKNYQFH